MPRNSIGKYVDAYEVISTTATQLGIDPYEVSRTLVDALNANRIRLMGKLVNRYELNEAGLLAQLAEYRAAKMQAVPRNWLKHKMKVATVRHGRPISRPFLCSEFSSIELRPVKKREHTMVLRDARLLRSDVHRVLKQAFTYSSPVAAVGVGRSDQTWGDVILHLLALERRNTLQSFRTPEQLLTSVLQAVPDTNVSTVKSVLTYLARSLEAERRK